MADLRVYKYVLQPTDRQIVTLPQVCQILDVATQRDEICMWALVDMDSKLEDRPFWIFGTGHQVPANVRLIYRGSAHGVLGGLVFHVFEESSDW